MDFFETSKLSVESTDVDAVQELLVLHLCGENSCKILEVQERELLERILAHSRDIGLGVAQFNELLLLLEQPIISPGFLKFFFGKEVVKFDDIKKGIVKFRGYAMLIFGNFRYAYKALHEMDFEQIPEKCLPYSVETNILLNEYKNRPQKVLDIETIEREKTWYLGYISKRKFKAELEYLEDIMGKKEKRPSSMSETDVDSLINLYGEIGNEIIAAEKIADKNTDVYLTWDYLDVYVATSMRNKWEYEETFDFITSVFSRERIQLLKLRYFDPTQSRLENRIDKGLVEGLMLKRAICTIYMAQETDTMGKDSELAATLAQGKPVIAYVPKIDINSYKEKIRNYPLEYFSIRLFLLRAEGTLHDKDCKNELRKKTKNYIKIIEDFEKAFRKYREDQLLSLWNDKEEEFKKNFEEMSALCKIVAICEHHFFERRARTLRERHPLSIQVNLQTGVANGVLVVRSSEDCSRLLYNLVTNSIDFEIGEVMEGPGATVLNETISKSPFRVVTNHTKLTNSFWVHYFTD